MELSHETLVVAAKTFGLIYLVILSIIVVGYAFWPSRQRAFHDAAAAILNQEDRPCR